MLSLEIDHSMKNKKAIDSSDIYFILIHTSRLVTFDYRNIKRNKELVYAFAFEDYFSGLSDYVGLLLFFCPHLGTLGFGVVD